VFVVIGLTAYAAGLRRGGAVAVMAITVSAESILPALVGLAVGDTVRAGAELAAVAGFVMAVGSAIAVALLDRTAIVPVGITSVTSSEARTTPAPI
jgi:hypothetical protein